MTGVIMTTTVLISKEIADITATDGKEKDMNITETGMMNTNITTGEEDAAGNGKTGNQKIKYNSKNILVKIKDASNRASFIFLNPNSILVV